MDDNVMPAEPAGGGSDAAYLGELRRAWVNEKAAPELLQYKREVVERLMRLVQLQEGELEAKTRDTHDITTASLYRMDLNRVKYLLRAYHRVRLTKIEEHVLHYIASEGGHLWARLSSHEQDFARGYTDIVEEHFRASVLHALPQQYDSIIKQIDDGDDSAGASLDMIPEPNRNSHVVCRVLEDRGAVEVAEGEEPVDLNVNDMLIIPYKPIASFVQDSSVMLF